MKRRGLSTVVGATFFVIAAATIITYVSYSMDLLDTYAQNVITKQTTDLDRINEKFEITSVTVDNNKFNMSVKNSGNVPLTLSRLWIKDLDVVDSTTRNEISHTIAPGQIKYNIGQNINYVASDSSPYDLKLVTERETNEKYFVNSATNEPLFMQLSATPTVLTSGFTTTVTFQVVNNLSVSNTLLNLQPIISTSGSAQAVLVSGPSPVSYSSLEKGDVATFRWVYEISGDTDTTRTFNATLANAIQGNYVTDTITLKEIDFSAISAVALETEIAEVSSGFISNPLSPNMLLFHGETSLTPSGEYQMYSSDSDGGTDGVAVGIDLGSTSFITQAPLVESTIFGGDWVASLRLQSEAMPSSLVGEGEDLIFHFEDGDLTPPDNSEGDSDRDLIACTASGGSGTQFIQEITDGNNDAEEREGSMTLDSTDLDMPQIQGDKNLVGLRFTNVVIPQGATIDNAYIIFQADETDNQNLDLKLKAHDHDNSPAFTTSEDDISDRQRTDAEVTWSNIKNWSAGEIGPDTTTPDLKTIIQEVIDRQGWTSGNSLVIIIDGDDSDERVAKSFESGGTAPQLVIQWSGGSGEYPDWQDGTGPHQSGSFYFDGQNDCFASKKNVSGNDGNEVDAEPDTTALWFKTDGAVSSEQYLVYWDGDGTCPNCDYYKIALDGNGKIVFEFETDKGSGDVTTCQSSNSYDDDEWYHVVAVREGTGSSDECTLYISDDNGNDTETPINQNNNYGTNVVNTDDKWYIGSNKLMNDNFFKGWIDDIIHWDDKALTAAEADELSKTNYGDKAHKINLYLDKTDTNGVVIENIDTHLGIDVQFYDSKALGSNDDGTYSIFNYTMPQAAFNVTTSERIKFKIEYVGSTSTWEPLELDMKIDDETMSPFPSYLQIPTPSTTFPSYVEYDPSAESLIFYVKNSSEDGHWLTYSLSRVVFQHVTDTSLGFGAVVDKINGTDVNEDKDSIFIPVNQVAELDFYKPSNPPQKSPGGAELIVDGVYYVSIYIQGYDDDGQMFLNTAYIGLVNVEN